MKPSNLYGMLAEFEDSKALIAAVKAVTEAGYKMVEAYTPYQIPELSEFITVRRSVLPFIVFAGGTLGAVAGFLMQYYASAEDYPLNVGGRPLNSWIPFIPLTFELAVFGAAIAAAFSMLVLCRLPQPSHPIFSNSRFARATQDGFFLCIESADPNFDSEEVRRLLENLSAVSVFEVENTVTKRTQRINARQSIKLLLLLCAVGLCSSCTHTMADQSRLRPLGPSSFFPDNQSARPIVAGTVARGYQKGDVPETYVYKSDEGYIDSLPFAADPHIVERGRQRYEIFCAVCHGRDGSGDGPVVTKGFSPVLSFYTEEVRGQPTGFYFDVITNGYREMGRYGYQVKESDRWAIIAYIRSLQKLYPARHH
jgi:mono/diheme cytochrome c family protein